MDGLGIDHHYHYPHQQHHGNGHFAAQQLPLQPRRKRKAEAPPKNNERLSKRMSLLSLDHSGQKVYVPVENREVQTPPSKPKLKPPAVDDSQMLLDDSKHKVYIYSLDDELSSDNESDAERPIFLPDIEKYLRLNRLQTRLLDPYPDPASEHAGKELVLYSEPSSLSVPAEQDSVRRAVIEARQRARDRQRLELGLVKTGLTAGLQPAPEPGQAGAATPGVPVPVPVPTMTSSLQGSSPGDARMDADEDPDAMELD